MIENISEIGIGCIVLGWLLIIIIASVIILKKKMIFYMRVTLWFCIINFTPIPINTSGRLADILIILSIANIMCFLSVIYSRKLTPDSFNEIEYIITCLLTIYSITAAFGNYYYCQGMIQNDDLVFLTCTRQEFLFSDTYFWIIDMCCFHFSLFKYSFQYYFSYTSETIQQIQFMYGIIIFGTIVATLHNRINRKIDNTP